MTEVHRISHVMGENISDWKRRLLIIDDDQDFAEALQDYLTPHGYDVEIVNDAGAVRQIAALDDERVVLIGFRLNKVDGVDLAEQLLDDNPDLVCVLITANTDMDATIHAMKLGVYDILRKPLNPHDIFASLERCFTRVNLERERRKASKALHVSEERYRNLVEGSIQGILVHRDGKALFANAAFAGIFDYDGPEEIYEINDILNLISPRERERFTAETNRRLAGEEALSRSEFEGKRKDGSTVFLELLSIVVEWEGVRSTQEVAVDITRRKQALLDRSGLAAALEQAGDAIFITDTDGVIEYANPAFERITGYSLDEAIGQTPSLLKSGEQNQAFYKNLWDTLQRGEVWKGRYVNRCKDGSFYVVEATHSPVRDEGGGIVQFISVQKDVTQQIQLEERLRRSQRMEAIGTLAGGIAHDFNNMLVPILGFTNLSLEMLEAGSEIRQNIKYVLDAAHRARDLVSQILVFSRQTESSKSALLLQPIVKEVVKLLSSTLPKSISLIQKLDDEVPPILADATQVHQVVMNLCVNANHAMPDGGTIFISLARAEIGADDVVMGDPMPGSYVRLTIMDTGVGMDMETLARIFEPFYTNRESGLGTGLGLSTVWGIIKQHNGGLNVVSSPGEGARFEVFFPIIEQAPDVLAPHQVEIPRGTERIMVVDDEELIALLGKQALEGQGYRVSPYTVSAEALFAFKQNPDDVDLLITDQAMPGISGDDLVRQFREIRRDLPVIMCTGYSELMNAETAHAQGIDKLLPKPYDVDQLKLVVREVLDKRMASRGTSGV